MGHGGPGSNVSPLVDITDVAVLGDHRLRLSFEDGTVGEVAFDERERRGVFQPLGDPSVFAQTVLLIRGSAITTRTCSSNSQSGSTTTGACTGLEPR